MVKMRGVEKSRNSFFVNFSLLCYFCSPSYTPVWSKGGALLNVAAWVCISKSTLRSAEFVILFVGFLLDFLLEHLT